MWAWAHKVARPWGTAGFLVVFLPGSLKLQHSFRVFRLRLEAGRIVRSFLIPRLVLWYQYLGVLLLQAIFIQYFTFNENLSEPSLRNAGNSVSECSILKISNLPPDPLRCLRLWRSQGALQRQDKFHIRCFHNHVCYFARLLKTLLIYMMLRFLSMVK